MPSKLAVGAALLASVFPGALTHHHRPGCPKLFTVKMDQRAAKVVYRDTRDVHEKNLLLLGRLEMCQRNPQAQRFVRRYNHHQHHLWWLRRNPPAPAVGAVGTGGWAIPAPIVMCESGGRDLPPNSASASGYYQVIHSTWDGFDGYDAAYLAPKAVQDRFAAGLWDGGRGAAQWVCAGLTGYA